MFTKLTRSGGHTYVQLVESFRDETGRPCQRTVSTLGRLDEVGGQVDALLKGLLRAKGMSAMHWPDWLNCWFKSGWNLERNIYDKRIR